MISPPPTPPTRETVARDRNHLPCLKKVISTNDLRYKQELQAIAAFGTKSIAMQPELTSAHD
jgi:hypothetical protein